MQAASVPPTSSTPYTLHLTPHTLHTAPYTLHPTPYTLHPTPYTLHPSPFTLHSTPCTLRSAPSVHLTRLPATTSRLLGVLMHGVRIHPENARMSGRHGVQYVAQCVACAALTLVVRQYITNLSKVTSDDVEVVGSAHARCLCASDPLELRRHLEHSKYLNCKISKTVELHNHPKYLNCKIWFSPYQNIPTRHLLGSARHEKETSHVEGKFLVFVSR